MSGLPSVSGRVCLFGPMAIEAGLERQASPPVGTRDFLIAVDGGLDHFARPGFRRRWGGRWPDLAIGDWDSLGDPALLHKTSIRSFPPEKDETDFGLALRMALRMRPRELLAVGFQGGRLDHGLGILLDLGAAARRGGRQGLRSVRAIGTGECLHFIAPGMPGFSQRIKAGQLFSVLPLTGMASGVTIQGARYRLKEEALRPGSRGLSNEGLGRCVKISVSRGVLVVVVH